MSASTTTMLTILAPPARGSPLTIDHLTFVKSLCVLFFDTSKEVIKNGILAGFSQKFSDRLSLLSALKAFFVDKGSLWLYLVKFSSVLTAKRWKHVAPCVKRGVKLINKKAVKRRQQVFIELVVKHHYES